MFSIFFNLKICCVVSLESPHQGNSEEYTQSTIFNIKKKENHTELSQICSYGIFSKRVNEPSVFESLNVYCTFIGINSLLREKILIPKS